MNFCSLSQEASASSSVQQDIQITEYIISNILLPGERNAQKRERYLSLLHYNPPQFFAEIVPSFPKKVTLTPKHYLALTAGTERVLVIGGALDYKNNPYPLNFFLLDQQKDVMADLAGIKIDLPQPVLTAELAGAFHTVIMEHLPGPVFQKPATFDNIRALLKSSGKLVSNPLCQTMKRTGILIKAGNLPLMEGVYYISLEHAPIPFMLYVDENKYPLSPREEARILGACFEKLVKPWFEHQGFKNVKLAPNRSYKERSALREEFIIEAEKS